MFESLPTPMLHSLITGGSTKSSCRSYLFLLLDVFDFEYLFHGFSAGHIENTRDLHRPSRLRNTRNGEHSDFQFGILRLELHANF